MPQTAIAWAIAVEKYNGSGLTFKQPIGAWALEFAESMLRKGVARLVLSTSMSFEVEYAPRFEALESDAAAKNIKLVRTGATQDEIQKALDQLTGADDALMIYWVGHGIMAPERELLCANSRGPDDPRCADVKSLLQFLRDDRYPRLQIGFFECCAQVVTSSVNSTKFGGDGRAPTDQFFYFAASAADIASGTTVRPGFSTTVLNAIKTLEAIPPPPQPFFDQLKAQLDKLSGPTRPVRLVRTEGSGDLWSDAAGSTSIEIEDAAEVAQLTRSQFERLWTHAVRSGRSPFEFATEFSAQRLPRFVADFRAAQPNSADPTFLENAAQQLTLERKYERDCMKLNLPWTEWQAFSTRVIREDGLSTKRIPVDFSGLLLNMLDQLDLKRGLSSFLKLMLLAARRSRAISASEKLCEALKKDVELNGVYPAVDEELATDDNRHYLLVDLDWEPNSAIATLKEAWTYPGLDGSFERQPAISAGTLAEQINCLVQTVMLQYPERPLVIELIAPNELLSMPAKLLEWFDPENDIPNSLAERAVTLRWKARLQDKQNRYSGDWASRSRIIQSRAAGAEALICLFQPPSQPSVAPQPNYHVVGLTFPGPSPSDPGRNKGLFLSQLKKGEPYMCWPREPADVAQFEKAVTGFLGARNLERLPLDLPDNRAANPELNNLALFIDVPERNPWAQPERLSETGQR